jgi:hypothetical protein
VAEIPGRGRDRAAAGQLGLGYLRLVLVALTALLIMALAGLLFRGVHGTVDVLVVLVVGVMLGDIGYLVDFLVGLLRMLFNKVLCLLLQVIELAHAILLYLTGPACRPGHAAGRYPFRGPHTARASSRPEVRERFVEPAGRCAALVEKLQAWLDRPVPADIAIGSACSLD